MSVLVDTNILLRLVEPDHPHFPPALAALSRLLGENVPVYFTLQNIAEFWSVTTRPRENNGLGYSVAMALREVAKIEELLNFLPDSPGVYGEWKRLVADHNVLGLKVHDARLVAVMKAHGIEQLLTFNAADFNRYTEIEVIVPAPLVN